uniref:SET domain-containing protein n=1 Tax=Angiostrongylus cantonensis TaxID=6313 RepID=A0A0K0DAV9_ANGCA
MWLWPTSSADLKFPSLFVNYPFVVNHPRQETCGTKQSVGQEHWGEHCRANEERSPYRTGDRFEYSIRQPTSTESTHSSRTLTFPRENRLPDIDEGEAISIDYAELTLHYEEIS